MSSEYLVNRYIEICRGFELADKNKNPSLRINTLKISEDEIEERLRKKKVRLEKIDFLKSGYYYNSPFKMPSSQEYLQGYVYLQDVASQIPAEVLGVKAGDKVLDMCAAPGSKTTQLGALMKNKGVIVSVENMLGRVKVLRNNLERCGVSNCLVYKKDARFVNELGIEFDKILLDAPCSGNYTQEETWLRERKVEDFKANARTQKEMIKSAVKCLKKDGVLVYSTCSLEPEENEMVIQWALDKLDVELMDIKLKVGDEGITNPFGKELDENVSKCVRVWPHKTGLQGFFVAKLKKK